jgi:hypothetical protein
MGAWGETAFESDAALDAIAGYQGYPSLLERNRVSEVIAGFLSGQAMEVPSYGEQDAYAACELVAIANAQGSMILNYWRELPYFHAIEEKLSAWLESHPRFSGAEVEAALAVLEELESERYLSDWTGTESRREALAATAERLRQMSPTPQRTPPLRPQRRRRPSALSERLS